MLLYEATFKLVKLKELFLLCFICPHLQRPVPH